MNRRCREFVPIGKMKLTIKAKVELLTHFDALLEQHGFKRPKRSQLWRKQISNEVSQFIHLNFGLYEREKQIVVNPSVAVRFESIEADCLESGMITSASAARANFGKSLQQISGRTYEWSDGENSSALAEKIYRDLVSYGLKYLQQISDLEQVLGLLKSSEPKKWCTESRSSRARYLPLALVRASRVDEALSLLPELAKDIQGLDQMIPDFQNFTSWFSEKYGRS